MKIASPTFYALKDSRTPVAVSVASIAPQHRPQPDARAGHELSRARARHRAGGALQRRRSLFWLLRRRLGRARRSARVMSFAGEDLRRRRAVMAAAAWGTEQGLSRPGRRRTRCARLVRVGLAVGVGLVTLAVSARLLRLHEFEIAFGRVMARLVRAADRASVHVRLRSASIVACCASLPRISSSTATRTSTRRCCRCSSRKLGLKLATAGVLAMVFQIAASVSQLGFGRLADRWHPHRLLVAGPIVTVMTLSLIGVAPTTPWLAVVLVVGGLGAAAFHPPGAMVAHRFSGVSPGFGMSLFVGGGATGFALAPLIFSAVTRALRPGGDDLADAARAGGAWRSCCVRCRSRRCRRMRRSGGFEVLRPHARPLGAALSDRRAAHGGGAVVRHVRAGVPDQPRPRASRRPASSWRSICSRAAPAASSADRSRIASARAASSSDRC